MILLKNRDRNPSFKKGEYVEINDAGNYPMELSIDGVCEQETTKGYQLLDITNNFESHPAGGGYATYKLNEKGGIELVSGNEGWAWSYTNSQVKVSLEAGTYIASANLDIRIFNSDGTQLENNFTLAETANIGICCKPNSTKGACYIIVEKGSTAHEYEPYTGGQPSPSPDYPQEIKTITDSLSVTSCNKNVFKITSPLKHHIASGVDISINDNVITLNGTATGAMWPDFIWGIQGNTDTHNKCKYYFSEQPEDCIASINVLSGTATGGFFVIVANDDSSSNFTFNFSNLQNTKTQKANGVNRAYLSGIDKGTKFDNFTFEIMLEKGSVATAFERHIESQIQANLPEGEFVGKINDTYKDTLKVEYNEEDRQYHLLLDKKVGRSLNNAVGNIYNSYTDIQYFQIAKPSDYRYYNMNTMDYSLIFTHATTKNSTGTWNSSQNIGKIVGAASSANFWIGFEVGTTLAQAQELLQNNALYYALKEPYVVDLGIVDTLLSYDEVTNVFSDSDLYPVINVKYYKDFEFDKILRSGYNIDEQEYEIAKKQMANGKRKRILSSYDDCIIKINLGLLDNKTYQEYKEQLDDGEFHYWSYKYNQYKKANFILTKPSITTEYAYDDDIGIDDMEITLEKSSDVS